MKNLLVIVLMTLCTFSLIFSSFTNPAQAEEKFEWIFYKYGSLEEWTMPYFQAWIKHVEKETNGKIKIIIKAGGELPYSSADIGRVVSTRKIEAGYVWDAHLGGWKDYMEVPTLPLMFGSIENARKALWDVVIPYWNELGKKSGFLVIHASPDVPEQLWTSFDMTSLDDLKGKTIRAAAVTLQEIVKQIGATPVSMSPSEVVMEVQRGLLHAATTSIPYGTSLNWYEALKYVYLANFSIASELCLLNRDALLELPKEWQDLVVKSAREMISEAINKATDENYKKSKQTILDAGGKFIEPSEADKKILTSLGLKIQNEWMAQKDRSEDAKKLYQLILDWKSK